MTREVPNHVDKLGQEIAVDDFVAFPASNTLLMGRVIKVNPKMIKITKIPSGRWGSTYNKYPNDIIKVDNSLASLYCLRTEK